MEVAAVECGTEILKWGEAELKEFDREAMRRTHHVCADIQV